MALNSGMTLKLEMTSMGWEMILHLKVTSGSEMTLRSEMISRSYMTLSRAYPH